MENKESQEKAIIKHLMGGGRITAISALYAFGCLRLSARIFNLRNNGWVIRDQFVTTQRGKRVKEYFI